jgi:hypothetical protein
MAQRYPTAVDLQPVPHTSHLLLKNPAIPRSLLGFRGEVFSKQTFYKVMYEFLVYPASYIPNQCNLHFVTSTGHVTAETDCQMALIKMDYLYAIIIIIKAIGTISMLV